MLLNRFARARKFLQTWIAEETVNDSDKGKIKFTDVTDDVAPGLKNIGMVCDALFTDFDNDNLPDLVLTGEWMPVTFFKNEGGKFKNVTPGSGVNDKSGWWNSIVGGDFRNTGRIDYIVGNVGSNTLYQATGEHPFLLRLKTFPIPMAMSPSYLYFCLIKRVS